LDTKKSILIGIGFLFFMVDLKAQEPTSAEASFSTAATEKAKESVDSFVQLNGN